MRMTTILLLQYYLAYSCISVEFDRLFVLIYCNRVRILQIEMWLIKICHHNSWSPNVILLILDAFTCVNIFFFWNPLRYFFFFLPFAYEGLVSQGTSNLFSIHSILLPNTAGMNAVTKRPISLSSLFFFSSLWETNHFHLFLFSPEVFVKCSTFYSSDVLINCSALTCCLVLFSYFNIPLRVLQLVFCFQHFLKIRVMNRVNVEWMQIHLFKKKKKKPNYQVLGLIRFI